MTVSDKKRREHSVLDFYLQSIGLKGDVVCQERPDFVVTVGDRRIGVEITEYHQPTRSGEKFSQTQVEAEWQNLRAAVMEYRRTHTGLENLSVQLSFTGLKVPGQRQHQKFIKAVHEQIERVKPGLRGRSKTIRIGHGHPVVLSTHLETIHVRTVDCYIQWNRNSLVGVGTSDDELTCILARKLVLKRPDCIDELHLVMAGDGPTGGTYIGSHLSPERLNRWTHLNSGLDRSDYVIVALFNFEKICLWRRDQGWSKIDPR